MASDAAAIPDSKWREFDAVLRGTGWSAAHRGQSTPEAVNALTAENETLRRVAYDLRDRLWFCTKLIHDVRQNSASRVSSAEYRTTEALSELAELRDKVQVLERELQGQAAAIAQQEGVQRESQRTNKHLRAALASAESEARETVLQLNADYNALQETLRERTLDMSTLEARLAAANDELACVHSRDGELAAQVRQQNALQAEMAGQLAAAKDLAVALRRVERLHRGAQDAVEQLRAENGQLRGLLAALGHCSNADGAAGDATQVLRTSIRGRSADVVSSEAREAGATSADEDIASFLELDNMCCGARYLEGVEHKRRQPSSSLPYAMVRTGGGYKPGARSCCSSAESPDALRHSARGAWVPGEAIDLLSCFVHEYCSEIVPRQALEAVIILVNEVFLCREARRIGQLRVRWRRQKDALTRKARNSVPYAANVQQQRARWNAKEEGTAMVKGGCKDALTHSMGKAFHLSRDMDALLAENMDLRAALAESASALEAARDAWDQGRAWGWKAASSLLLKLQGAQEECLEELRSSLARVSGSDGRLSKVLMTAAGELEAQLSAVFSHALAECADAEGSVV